MLQQDSSSSSNDQQFRRIYQRQLRKKEEKEMKKIQDVYEKKKYHRRINFKHQNKPRQVGLHHHRQRSVQRQHSRSRSRQQPKQLKWFIYQKCQNLGLTHRIPSGIACLPIFAKKQQIITKIIKNQIVLITGQTGCGKSTQVPRLLYEYMRELKLNGKIMCIQPRRLAVLNLQSMLDRQMVEKDIIGYQIGMQAHIKPWNKIIFMTNGIFLQRLVHNTDFFEEYPFILLDQVHQRDIDTDFILLAMKRIVRLYPKLRIILMSATIDNELFRYYFSADHIDKFLNDENVYKKIIRNTLKLEHEKHYDSDEEFNVERQGQKMQQEQQLYENYGYQFMSSLEPCPTVNITEPGQFKRQVFYLDTLKEFLTQNYSLKYGSIIFSEKYPNTHRELYEIVSIIIEQISHNNNTQDYSYSSILVFMPGLAEIQGLSESIIRFFGRDKANQQFEIIHIHSSILNEEVSTKLHTLYRKKLKIMLATNIAQSSITVLGVKYVIDFCLSKQIRFDLKSRMQNLELVWASQASCKQRAGRTGRVCDGIIIRMVQKSFYQKIPQYSTPQMQRSSLDKLILRIKMIHQSNGNDIFADPGDVLGSAIQPPKLRNIDSSIKSLLFCGGLQYSSEKFALTDLGRLYIQIPIDICYCKMLIISLLFGTYSDILILVSILSQNKNPFRRMTIEKNNKQYYEMMDNESSCDFLALINSYKLKKKQLGSKKNFGRVQFEIFHQTQQMILDIEKRIKKKQFYIQYQKQFNLNYKKDCNDSDYLERFKMTIVCGFIDKFIRVRSPMYDDKQEKRIKLMNKSNISNNNTVVLMNSQVIKKNGNNPQADQKLKNLWLEILGRNLKIYQTQMTLGYGISFLHFKHERDLNKLLFIKFIQDNKKMISESPNNSLVFDQSKQGKNFITISNMLRCFGDLDHMQQGRTVTYCKQQKINVDYYSLNRVVNINENSKQKFMVSNCFMQQSSRLACRYTSLLPAQIPYFDIIAHLMFYPFLTLLPNKKKNRYQYLYFRRKHRVNVKYQLNKTEIEQANQIRLMLKHFLQLKGGYFKHIAEFWAKVKLFLNHFRRDCIDEEYWQQAYFKQMQSLMLNQKQKADIPEVFLKQLENIYVKNEKTPTEYPVEQKVFLNQISVPKLQMSYFSGIFCTVEEYQSRIHQYNQWKIKKIAEIQEIQNKAIDHQPYLACAQGSCGIKLCKLGRVGPISREIYRDIYQPLWKNIHEMPFNQIGSHFCSMMMANFLEKDFTVYTCSSGHYFSIKIQGQKNLKITAFSQLMIIYGDGSAERGDFHKLQPCKWKKKSQEAVKRKLQQSIDTYCFICDCKFQSIQSLQEHIKDTYHSQNFQGFKRTLSKKVEVKQNDDFY